MVARGVRRSCETDDSSEDLNRSLSSSSLARSSASPRAARSRASAPWLANVFTRRSSAVGNGSIGRHRRISPTAPLMPWIGVTRSGRPGARRHRWAPAWLLCPSLPSMISTCWQSRMPRSCSASVAAILRLSRAPARAVLSSYSWVASRSRAVAATHAGLGARDQLAHHHGHNQEHQKHTPGRPDGAR